MDTKPFDPQSTCGEDVGSGGGGRESTGADLSQLSLVEIPRGGRRWCQSEEEAPGEAATLPSSPCECFLACQRSKERERASLLNSKGPQPSPGLLV